MPWRVFGWSLVLHLKLVGATVAGVGVFVQKRSQKRYHALGSDQITKCDFFSVISFGDCIHVTDIQSCVITWEVFSLAGPLMETMVM